MDKVDPETEAVYSEALKKLKLHHDETMKALKSALSETFGIMLFNGIAKAGFADLDNTCIQVSSIFVRYSKTVNHFLSMEFTVRIPEGIPFNLIDPGLVREKIDGLFKASKVTSANVE